MMLTLPDYPEVKGVFVDGRSCIEGRSLRRNRGHAHTSPKDVYRGWICVRKSRVGNFTLDASCSPFDGTITSPSRTVFHEIAHIRTPGHGHDNAWKAEMHRLGQSVPRQYSRAHRQRRFTTWVLKCGCQVKIL